MEVYILEEYMYYGDGDKQIAGYVTDWDLANYWRNQQENSTASTRFFSKLECKDEELKYKKELHDSD